MARRRFLVAYDIADPIRLRRVCAVMEEHGDRLQYSVFLCDLGAAERAEMESAVTSLMNLAEDSVVEIDLGPVAHPAPSGHSASAGIYPAGDRRSCEAAGQ